MLHGMESTQPRLAATIMLLRERAPRAVEIFMLRRSARSAFAPDAFVFPGGTVDEADYADEAPASRDARMACEPRDARAIVRACVRELREEAAIEIAPEELVYFSHWITPPTEPRRYDTHFFLARAPGGALGVADAFETHDALWLSPREALQRHRDGEMHVVYPTVKHLERLKGFERVADALAFAREKPILTIMPHGSPSDGFAIPAELEAAW